MNKTLAAIAATVALALPSSVMATSVGFSVDSASVNIPGQLSAGSAVITETLNPSLVGTSFSMAEGDTAFELDFFDLTATGDGLGVFSIEASLNFLPPGGGISSSGGGGFGTINTFLGQISGGVLLWTNPTATVYFGPGNSGIYTITLEDGFTIGKGSTETVSAYVDLVAAPVPLPAAGWMLLAGLGGLIAVKRRKTAIA